MFINKTQMEFRNFNVKQESGWKYLLLSLGVIHRTTLIQQNIAIYINIC